MNFLSSTATIQRASPRIRHVWAVLAFALLMFQAPAFAGISVVSLTHSLHSNSTVYKVCSFNTAPSSLHTSIGYGGAPAFQGQSEVWGSFAGSCATDPGGTWTPVTFSVIFEGLVDHSDCAADPTGDTYVLHGGIEISNGGTIPAKLIVRTNPIGNLITLVDASIVDDLDRQGSSSVPYYGEDTAESHLDQSSILYPMVLPSFSSKLYVSGVVTASTPSPIDTVLPSPVNGGCYRPRVSFMNLSGTLNAADSNSQTAVTTAGGTSVDPTVDTGLNGVGNAAPTSAVVPVVNTVETTACSKAPCPTLPASNLFEEDYLDTGDIVDEDQALDVMALFDEVVSGFSALANSIASPPLPAYTITVKYKDITGVTRQLDVPAIYGVPTPVVLPLAQVGSDTFIVTLGSQSSASLSNYLTNNNNYVLHIQRASSYTPSAVNKVLGAVSTVAKAVSITTPPSTCVATPVDIDAKINLSSPIIASGAGPSVPTVVVQTSSGQNFLTVGYHALSASASDSPKDFALVFMRESNSGFSIHERSTSCGTPQPLKVVGHFTDNSTVDKATDLETELSMPRALASMDIAVLTDQSGKKTVRYQASDKMDSLMIYGVDQGSPITLTTTTIPENMSFCNHTGNGCNEAWRANRNSQRSAGFSAWDAQGKISPIGVYYFAQDATDPSKTTTVSGTVADLAIDFKTPKSKAVAADAALGLVPGPLGNVLSSISALFGSKGARDYPYWVFMDTRGSTFTGQFKGKQIGVSTSQGIATWGRELVLKKKWYGTRFYHYGSIVCNDLSFDFGGGIKGNAESGLARYEFCK